MPDRIEINKKRHQRRSRRRKNKTKEPAQIECICQDFQNTLDARLDMVEKRENGQYDVCGICICPIHGEKKFIAFYVKNTRDVDLTGFMEEDLISEVRTMICYTMY